MTYASQTFLINIPSLTPLIEEINELQSANLIVANLLENKRYKNFVKTLKTTIRKLLAIQTQTKTVVLLHRSGMFTKLKFYLKLLKKIIQILIFSRQRRTISRGGGPTYDSIMSHQRGQSYLKLVQEQGEVISDKYSTPI